jgi:hypothetical protein
MVQELLYRIYRMVQELLDTRCLTTVPICQATSATLCVVTCAAYSCQYIRCRRLLKLCDVNAVEFLDVIRCIIAVKQLQRTTVMTHKRRRLSCAKLCTSQFLSLIRDTLSPAYRKILRLL